MKKLLNSLKKKASPSGPRQFVEIEREFQQLSAQAANAQYRIYVHSEELKVINRRLTEINSEAGERQRLDEQVKAEIARKQKAESPQEQLDLTKAPQSGAV